MKYIDMEGIIEMEGMEFFAYHGCYDTERLVGNKFIVHVTLITNCDKATVSDNIHDTLNYLSAYEIVAREMKTPSRLLEHVARRVLEALHDTFPELLRATVKVSKLNPPLGGKVAATSVTLSK
ncbi:MAG: dihydroneopterin aldolase [Odoribacteraceae bacterium]|jgi:dihydroneopterin aldolase|nr:dihydroneopterin aldolase [Odoribacteraceae bacterium]